MRPQLREFIKTAGAPALLAGVLAIVLPLPATFAVLAIAASVAVAAVWPMLAWGIVVLTYPFIYLQLFIGSTVNVPYVDLAATIAVAGLAVRWLSERWQTGRWPMIGRLPGLIPFLAFLAAGALSLMNVERLAPGAKFLLRPLSFFYIAYIALPAFVIDRPKRLFTTFRILFAVGGIAAAMGIWSLVFPPEPGAFRRALPVIVHGMTPLGTNHNLIAEVLVAVIPIGILLAAYSQGIRRRWYVVLTACYALVNLLTFSRNGWITLAVEAVMLFVALARDREIAWRRIATLAAPFVVVAALVVTVFSFTSVARSSNTNRLQLTAIALAEWRAHPWVGNGVGTFIEAVSRDRWYLADFGSPQEAHGMVQKLLAETGALGLVTFAFLLASFLAYLVRVYRAAVAAPGWRLIVLGCACAAAGSIVFQLFNTSYFVSKMWLPIGIAIAAARLAERGIAVRRASASPIATGI